MPEGQRTQRDGTPSWHETFFGEDYLRLYRPLLTAERTEAEVEGIVTLMDLPAGSAILDLACGHGRHAIPLARRGYRVTGQDLSQVFLKNAEEAAREAGADVRWRRGDMRDVPFEDEFDAVINVFTAFGYFETDEEDLLVLSQVRKALKPGGVFLLEAMHRDALVRGFQANGITRHEDGLVVLEERRFDHVSGRNHVRITMIERDGKRTEHTYAVRVYTPTELGRLCVAAGLEPQGWYGGLNGSPLGLNSQRLVLVCRCPAP